MKAILDLLFPARCVGCKERGVWLCPDCMSGLARVGPYVCKICGYPTAGTQLCSLCYRTPLHIQGIRAPFYFEGTLRNAIHKFKYQRAKHLAEPLTMVLVEYLSTNPTEANIIQEAGIIVPVPLHESRFKERGYNQSELLAEGLGRAFHTPVANHTLRRTRPTKAQMSLPADERAANVRGAFACQDSGVSGQRVLVVDDVCTTGATLEACSIALARNGASAVWGLCIARARRSRQPTRPRR